MIPNLRIRFEVESKGGNNVFLDDINVYGVDSMGNVLSLDPVQRDEGVGLRVYPNPSQGSVTVDALWPGGNATLLVRDATGRLVRTEGLRKGPRQQVRFDGLSPGVHLVELHSSTWRDVRRLVITK